MYCGGEVSVREAIQKFNDSINLDNIFQLAQAAEESGNYQESYDYYTKILEVNPRNHKAWYGKAIAAGWLSTLGNLRLAETLQGIDRALELAPEADRPILLDVAGSELNRIASAIRNLAVENFRLFITLETYTIFISRMKMVIATYRRAALLKPGDGNIHKNLIEAAKQYMYRYTCFGGQKKVFLTEQGYAQAKQFILEAEANIQKIDPAYRAQIPKHEHGACYVATTIYGSYDCEEVMTLREFRDYTLSTYTIGRFFIASYYRVGPSLALRVSPEKAASRVVRKLLDELVHYLKKGQGRVR
jgi:tetratricopeptide (TPR) repeat protein